MRAALLALLVAAPGALLAAAEPHPPDAAAPTAASPRGTEAVGFDTLWCPGPTLDHPLERCNLRASAQVGPGNEVELALDPADPRHVVVVAKGYNYTRTGLNPDGSPNTDTRRTVITPYGATFDGGLTWTEGYLQPFTPHVPLVAGWAVGSVDGQESDPVVDMAPDGAVIAVTLHVTEYPVADGLPVYRSEDGGRTFARIADAYPHGQPDKQWMAIDPRAGTAHVVTTDFQGSRQGAWHTRSADGGFTWSAPVKLCGGCYFPTIDVGKGELHVATVSGSRVQAQRSLDDGATWSAPVRLGTYHGMQTNPLNLRLFRAPTFATIGASRADASVYVVWQDTPAGSPDLVLTAAPTHDVMLARSRDGGLTWSAPQRVNDDPTDLMLQAMPTLAVSPRGDVHVAWFDQRHDPSGLTVNLYYAHSADGDTFDPNLLVSDAPWEVAACHHQNPVNYPGNGVFIGDYLGIGATDTRAVLAFPDTRYGRCDVFVATIV